MPKAIPKSHQPNGQPGVGQGRRRRPERADPVRPSGGRIGRHVRRELSLPVAIHRPPSPPVATVSSTTSPRGPSPSGGAGTSNFLLEALRRIRELQDELDFLQNDPYAEDTDDDDDDDDVEEDAEVVDGGEQAPAEETVGGHRAEAIGWAVCARETMHFLQREGIPPDSPLMVNLRRRLIGAHGHHLDGLDEGLSC